MKRRGFLKLLGLLPFAPKAAEAALEVAAMAAAPAPLKFMGCPVVVHPGLSDQTSIWLVGGDWGSGTTQLGHKITDDLFMYEMGRQLEQEIIYNKPPKRNWLKEKLRGR